MDDKLFQEALDEALARDEVASRLEQLRRFREHDPRHELTVHLYARRTAIESAASGELARLDDAQRAYDEQVNGLIEDELAADSVMRSRVEDQRRRAQNAQDAALAKAAEATAAGERLAEQDRTRNWDDADGGRRRRFFGRGAPAEHPRTRAFVRVSDLRRASYEAGQEAVAEQVALAELLAPVRERVEPQRVEAAAKRLSSARDAARLALVERGILPTSRSWLNETLLAGAAERYSHDLSKATGDGLSQLDDPRLEIATATKAQLQAKLDRLAYGSIGISGPRGSGKTTLIAAFCSSRRDPRRADAEPPTIQGEEVKLRVMVSAPVRFDAMSFVLHLFEKVCREVLPRQAGLRPLGGSDDEELTRLRRLVSAASLVCVLTAAALICAGVWLLVDGIGDSTLSDARQRLLIAGALTTLGSLAVASAPGRLDSWLAPAIAGVSHVALAAIVLLETPGALADWLCAFAGLLALAAISLAGAAGQLAAETDAAVSVAGGVAVVAGLVVATSAADDGSGTAIETGGLLLVGSGIAVPLLLGILRTRVELVPSDEDDLPHSVRAQREVMRTTLRGARTPIAGAGAMVGGLGAGLIVLGLFDRSLDGTLVAGLALAGGGSQLALGGLMLRRHAMWMLEESAQRARDQSDVQAKALEHLRRIKFLQSHSASWSGKVAVPGSLKLPFSAEASLGGGRSAAELPLTFPELVDDFREFLTDALEGADDRAAIGIDELDKIGSDEEAQAFLNEIKAIFGVPHCYFLVSVSEDAVASFERRGMPFRDAFDSAFDDVLRVEHFKLAASEKLLRNRTLEMSLPFMALCHVLSGGLPRDLVRVARRLFALRDEGQGMTLDELCPALVADELLHKRDGTVTAVRRLGEDVDTSPALTWLGAWRPILTRQAVTEDAPPCVPEPPELPEARAAAFALQRLLHEFAAARWLGVTLVEFFTNAHGEQEYARAEQTEVPHGIDHLAEARQAFAVDPELVLSRVSAFRCGWGPQDSALAFDRGNGADGDHERLVVKAGPYRAVVTGPPRRET